MLAPKIMNKVQFGRSAEELAIEYLKPLGYIFVEKNFTIRGGEIDLIFRNKNADYYYFVEVKARKDLLVPLNMLLSKAKKRTLIKTSKIYLAKHKLNKVNYQLDFLGIYFPKNQDPEFHFYPNSIY